jgi:hypothetical protein
MLATLTPRFLITAGSSIRKCSLNQPRCSRTMRRFRRLSMGLIIAYVFIGALVISSVRADESALRTYRNDTAGYTITYHGNWYPSPPFYANAFEIRNYDASHAVPEKDQASIITSQEGPVSPEQAERRIQDLLSAASTGKSYHLEKLKIGPLFLYQWTVLERPAVPAGHPTKGKPVMSDRMRLRVASAVVLGPQIVRMEGKAWEDADPEVLAEMKEITRSVRPRANKEETK